MSAAAASSDGLFRTKLPSSDGAMLEKRRLDVGGSSPGSFSECAGFWGAVGDMVTDVESFSVFMGVLEVL